MPGATGPERGRAAQAGALNQEQTSPRRQGERRPQAADSSSRERGSGPGPEAEVPTCETDYYLPQQGCVGLLRCCLSWGQDTGYLPTQPEIEICVRPHLAPSGVCYT